MALQRYRYLHFDVFTATRFGGNQLAVFLDAAGLSTATMQAMAREMNFAESTFVMPAESAGTDVRMRIFTPASEMPMAGHPVIGSTFALAREGRIPQGASAWTFGLNIGPLSVELQWREGQLAFAWMTQRNPEFGAPEAPAPVARALGLAEDAIRSTGLPIQQVSCGVPVLIVPVATRAAVDGAAPDARLMQDLKDKSGVSHFVFYLFTTDRTGAEDAATVYTRMFAPALGIYEDPATGGASGPLGCYLVRHGVVPPEQAGALLNLQGQKLGRPSWLHISIESANGAISRVRVGGEAVFVAEGSFEV
jgi:trans-2,3-dihydro-3-hydroxyanthranilate isomerase